MKVSINPSAVQTYLTQNLSKLRPTTSLVISSAKPQSIILSNNNNLNDNALTTPNKKDHQLSIFHDQISHHTESISFYTGMQFNLKTVSYGSNTLSSSFPTIQNSKEVMELMGRTMGNSTNLDNAIFGVGSGPAIDLAKACYYHNTTNYEKDDSKEEKERDGQHLVLIPSTLGGVLACGSRKSLILDIHEEALTVSPNSPILKSSSDNITVLIDEKSLTIPSWLKSTNIHSSPRRNIPTIVDASIASLAIAIDTILVLNLSMIHKDDSNEKMFISQQMNILKQSMKSAISCLERIINSFKCDHEWTTNKVLLDKDMKYDAIDAVLNGGKLLSFGDDRMGKARSITLALSCALLPKYFPHGNWLTFSASLLPGLMQTMNDTRNEHNILLDADINDSIEWIKEEILMNNGTSRGDIVPTLSSLAEGAPDTNELSQRVDDNGALLNCLDCDSDLLENILLVSLNR